MRHTDHKNGTEHASAKKHRNKVGSTIRYLAAVQGKLEVIIDASLLVWERSQMMISCYSARHEDTDKSLLTFSYAKELFTVLLRA